MGKQPTNILPPGVFKEVAEQKSDVGALRRLQFVEHGGQPGVVFRTTMRNEKGNVEAANTFVPYNDINRLINKLVTDHLPHEKLDHNLAALKDARTDLKAVIDSGIPLTEASKADIARMTPLDNIAQSLKVTAASEATRTTHLSPPPPLMN